MVDSICAAVNQNLARIRKNTKRKRNGNDGNDANGDDATKNDIIMRM